MIVPLGGNSEGVNLEGEKKVYFDKKFAELQAPKVKQINK